jgi:RecA/RadA recombinase
MNLLEEMRRRRVNAMVADACYLTAQPDSDERNAAIEQLKRSTMYELAVGKITEEEKQAVFEILDTKGEDDASISVVDQEVPSVR